MIRYRKIVIALFVLAAVSSVSCTQGIRLNTQGAQDSEPGSYTVIFFGCNFNNDLETIAFLDREGDKYSLAPYAPDFKYRTKKGVDAKDALSQALEFVDCNTSFRRAQLSRVAGPGGETIGYEVRPLYHSFTYGVDDVLNVDYTLSAEKVNIYIRLVPSLESILQGGGRVRTRE